MREEIIKKELTDSLNNEVTQDNMEDLFFQFDFEELFSIPTSIEAHSHSQPSEQENESTDEVMNQPLSQETAKKQLIGFISLSNSNQAAAININDIFDDLENNNNHSAQSIHLYQERFEFSNQTMFNFFETQVDTGLEALKQGLYPELNSCI